MGQPGNPSIQLWNVHDDVTARVGSQQRFNVVGTVDDPDETAGMRARLNGADWIPVPVNLTGGPKTRLCAPGDFNIDGIDVDDLGPTNVLEIRQSMRDGSQRSREIRFHVEKTSADDHGVAMALRPGEIEEFCQVVDGEWRVVGREGSMSIGISRDRAGYDRIVLFGDRRWTTGYEVEACLTVDAWTYYVHNVGLVFKWNTHLTDQGTALPITWSTGLAYYASATPGLRMRFGVDVTYDRGVRYGDHVLKEAPRFWWSRIPFWLLRGSWHLSGRRVILSQLRTGVRYRFRAQVHPDLYTLTVWRDGQPAPRKPQVVVPRPTEHLSAGAVGIIAQNAATRVHEFAVRPIAAMHGADDSGARAPERREQV